MGIKSPVPMGLAGVFCRVKRNFKPWGGGKKDRIIGVLADFLNDQSDEPGAPAPIKKRDNLL